MKLRKVSILGALVVVITVLSSCGSTDAADTAEPTQAADAAPDLENANWPSNRKYGAMVYDPVTERVLMLGGSPSYENYRDFPQVWAFDAAADSWQLKAELGPKYVVSAAVDEESQRVIVVGRGGINDENGTTWAYDPAAGTWQQMNPEAAPFRRWGPQMVYDAESDRIILFGGGKSSDISYKDTWAYDYNTDKWTEMKPSASPPDRGYPGMVYDSNVDRVLLWGGSTEALVEDVRVWAYDYNTNTWTAQEAPSNAPQQRSGFGMFYHPPSDRVILYGGLTEGNGQLVDETTWAYDYGANSWQALAPSTNPGKRAYFPMAYAAAAGKFVIFGGEVGGKRADEVSDETWEFDPGSNEWEDVNRP